MKIICVLTVLISMFTSALAGDAPGTNSIEVLNEGIGGQTAQHGLRRFETDVLENKPQWLILYFGINDALNQNIPVTAFVKAMETMIESAQSNGISHVVLVTPNPFIEAYLIERHPDHAEAADLTAHLAKYEAATRTMAEKYQLPLVDLKKMVLAHGGATEEESSLIRNPFNSSARDGIHLTAEGYKLFAELFVPVFKGKIKPGDTVVCLGDSLTFGSFMEGEGTSEGETYPAFLKTLLNQDL